MGRQGAVRPDRVPVTGNGVGFGQIYRADNFYTLTLFYHDNASEDGETFRRSFRHDERSYEATANHFVIDYSYATIYLNRVVFPIVLRF